MAATRTALAWLKRAWDREPVLFISVLMGVSGPVFVALSPLSKEAFTEIDHWPTHYRRAETLESSEKE